MLWSPGSDWRWEWMWSILYWRWCDFCSPIRRLHVRWHTIQLKGRTETGSDLFLKVQKTHSFSRNTILFSSTHFQCHGNAWRSPAAFVSEHTSTWKSSGLTTHAHLQGGDLEWLYWKLPHLYTTWVKFRICKHHVDHHVIAVSTGHRFFYMSLTDWRLSCMVIGFLQKLPMLSLWEFTREWGALHFDRPLYATWHQHHTSSTNQI